MQSVHTHPLRAHEVLRLPETNAVTLRVRRGRIWVTQANCLDDWFLEAGQTLHMQGPRIVIEAETASEVDIAHSAARAPWRFRRFRQFRWF